MDRFTRGFIAGVIAGMFEFLAAFTLYSLKLTEVLWQDFASVMIFGRKPIFLGERVLAELGVWTFAGLMGVFYAYIIANIGSRNHILKGLVYGLTIWFGVFAITLLFKVPEFKIITFKSSVSNFILAGIWGFITTEILHWLDNRVKA